MSTSPQTEPTTLDAIKNAPAPVPQPSGKATSELEMLAHEQEQFRNELGYLGKPLGGKKEKPGNISGLVIVMCFIFLGAAYAHPPKETLGMNFEQIFSGLLSIVTLVLGYLFGSNDRA